MIWTDNGFAIYVVYQFYFELFPKACEGRVWVQWSHVRRGTQGWGRNKGKEQPKGALIQPVTTVGVWGLILLGTFGSWGGASSPIISRSELALFEGCPGCHQFWGSWAAGDGHQAQRKHQAKRLLVIPSTLKNISFGKAGEGIKLRNLGQLTRPWNLRNLQDPVQSYMMSQQLQWRGGFWRRPQGKYQLRGAAFMSDHPCWSGLFSDSAAFESSTLLEVTPHPHSC